MNCESTHGETIHPPEDQECCFGIPEAPLDGNQYGRQNGTWTQVTGGSGGGIPEAPVDGKQYGRQNGNWTEVKVAEPNQYLKSITKDTTNQTITITDKTDKAVTFEYGKGEGTNDYENLINKPQIGGVTLEGNIEDIETLGGLRKRGEGAYHRAYTVLSTGETAMREISFDPSERAIPKYTDDGILRSNDPQSGLDVVNKQTLDTELESKQDKLVSGTNIKTINHKSILGEGNIDIEGGSGITLVKYNYDGTTLTDAETSHPVTFDDIHEKYIDDNYEIVINYPNCTMDSTKKTVGIKLYYEEEKNYTATSVRFVGYTDAMAEYTGGSKTKTEMIIRADMSVQFITNYVNSVLSTFSYDNLNVLASYLTANTERYYVFVRDPYGRVPGRLDVRAGLQQLYCIDTYANAGAWINVIDWSYGSQFLQRPTDALTYFEGWTFRPKAFVTNDESRHDKYRSYLYRSGGKWQTLFEKINENGEIYAAQLAPVTFDVEPIPTDNIVMPNPVHPEERYQTFRKSYLLLGQNTSDVLLDTQLQSDAVKLIMTVTGSVIVRAGNGTRILALPYHRDGENVNVEARDDGLHLLLDNVTGVEDGIVTVEYITPFAESPLQAKSLMAKLDDVEDDVLEDVVEVEPNINMNK